MASLDDINSTLKGIVTNLGQVANVTTQIDTLNTEVATLNTEVATLNSNLHLNTPVNLYVAATGSDSNDGKSPATAVLTIQHAVDLAFTFDFNQGHVQINVGAGTFSGTAISGPFRGGNTGGTDEKGGFLILSGAGSGSTNIGQLTTGVFAGLPLCIVISGCFVQLQNFNINVPTACDGVALLDFGYCVYAGDVSMTGTDSSCVACAAEGLSFHEMASAFPLDIKGTFGPIFSLGANGEALIDPSVTSIRIYGTVNQIAFLDMNSVIEVLGVAAPFALQGGSATTGAAYSVRGNSYFNNEPGNTVSAAWVAAGGSIGDVANGGRTRGMAAAPTATATGIGSTGTITIAPGSDSRNGTLVMTTGGAGIAATGTATIAFHEVLLLADQASQTQYVVCLNNSTGTWNARATVIGGTYTVAVGSYSVQVLWDNNAVALTGGQVYQINYITG